MTMAKSPGNFSSYNFKYSSPLTRRATTAISSPRNCERSISSRDLLFQSQLLWRRLKIILEPTWITFNFYPKFSSTVKGTGGIISGNNRWSYRIVQRKKIRHILLLLSFNIYIFSYFGPLIIINCQLLIFFPFNDSFKLFPPFCIFWFMHFLLK